MCAQTSAINNGMMEVGVARIDITPESPIRLTGFAAREKSEATGVMQRLSAKALVFGSDAQGPSVFITVDLIGIQWRTTKKLVEQLSKKTGIKPAQIVICASHTHGGPEIGNLMNCLQCRGDYPNKYNFTDSLLELDQLIHIAQFNETLSDKLIEVALSALKNRKPAKVAWGRGEASFAVNRRTEGGPVDHTMPMLSVTNPDGSLRAVLVNYACHGISLGPDVNDVHGDWMGAAQEAIEAKYPGAIALVSIGCSGDAHPRLRDKSEYAVMNGTEIADNVERLLKSTLQPLTTPPAGKMKWIKLPFSKMPTVPELITLTKTDTTIKGYYARLALERIQRGELLPSELNYPIQIWGFKDKMMMVNMGGEVVVDYSTRLKRELGAERLWINAYANDVACYIASQRVLKEGGYEADASMYWYNLPAPLSEKVEDIIINTIHELIPDSFSKNKHQHKVR